MELLSEHRAFGGRQRFYRHDSARIGLPMRFSVFLPRQAETARVPVLFYLAGLTCTEETFMIKAGAQRLAAEHGIMLVSCDTSPRGAGAPGETDHWDFGVGAGFYLDARTEGYAPHYRMESYVAGELFDLVTGELPGDAARAGIFGHSMGGHGALTLALRHPGRWASVSAFAPIAAPRAVRGARRPSLAIWRGRRGMGPARCQRAHARPAQALSRGHPDRPGAVGSIPGRATVSRGVRGRLPGCRAAAHAAPP